MIKVNEKIEKAFGYALILVALTIPFSSSKANSVSIILLALLWILEGNFRVKWKLLVQQPVILIFCVFYFLHLFGLVYTENISVGKSDVEQKLSLLALPLIIGTSISYNNQMMKKVLGAFVLSCLIACLLCLGNALFHFLSSGKTIYFLHEDLASIIDLQPVYFGIFLCFSILTILFQMWDNRSTMSNFQMGILGALVFFFFTFIVLLSARMTMLFMVVYLMTGGLYFFYTINRIRAGLIIFLAIVSLGFILVAQSSYLKDRIVRPLTSDVSVIGGGGETGLSMRIVKWKCSVEGIVENPIIGVGTGDVIDYLVSCYERKNFWGRLPEHRFNSHNQYLQTALTLGFLGLMVFLSCLIIPGIYAWRRKDFLFLSFVLLFSFCCLTESALERQWGVVFFTFFTSIFSFLKREEA